MKPMKKLLCFFVIVFLMENAVFLSVTVLTLSQVLITSVRVMF